MAARRLTLAGLLLCLIAGSALSISVAQAAGPPSIEEEYAVNVSDSSVTLRAQLNPQGTPTTYSFEYGPTAAYGASTPQASAGTFSQLVSAAIQGLNASTVYHYRLVAVSSAGTIEGPDHTFVTQPTGAPLSLLDGRQWEVVSPQDKHGAGIRVQPAKGGVIQAMEDGSGISYLASSPIEGSPEGYRGPELAQILAERGAGGWSNRTIDTPNEETHSLAEGLGSEYRMFTPDLSVSLIEPRNLTPLTSNATERTPYLRNQAACEAHASGCYTALVTPEDTMPGAKWDPNPSYVFSEEKVVSATSDLKHVVIYSTVPLTAGASERGLYEWSGGQLQFVSLLPEGEGSTAVDGELGAGPQNMRGAISQDGSRIVWSFNGHVYLTDTARGETIRLDPSGVEQTATFQIANNDDSRIFFTYREFPNPQRMYECEVLGVAGKLTCNRHEVASEVAADDVLGASEDGTDIYFAASGVLASGATPGNCFEGPTCNLYVAQLEGGEWSVRFVAALASGFSESDAAGPQDTRVSPSGRFLAFMSDRSLTGYDNRDAVSGMPDEEVYLYDAAARQLTCASCDSSGARPQGMLDPGLLEPMIDPLGAWGQRWIAATLPPWSNMELSSAVYQPRYLSDSGRLFFNSADALVPQDANGLPDIYEYEPEGVGSCTQGSGCVDLISSGASGEEAGFLDASANGNDVFFITSAQLTASDEDTSYDVYDAHVCSASAPCLQQSLSPPPCSSGDACKGPPTPQPSSFGPPASATFSGQGNVIAPSHKSVKPRSVARRAQKLARALRLCRRRHSHHKRKLVACKRRARRLYGNAAKGGHNGRGR